MCQILASAQQLPVLTFMMHLLLRVASSPLVSSVSSAFQEIGGSPPLIFDKRASGWLSNQSHPEAFLGLAGDAKRSSSKGG